jgi:hypothetical protein
MTIKKLMNTVCDYLKIVENKCGIYNERTKHGFSCRIQFECYGVSHGVTELFRKLYDRPTSTTTSKNIKNDIFQLTWLTLHDKFKLKDKNKIAVNAGALYALRPFVNAAITLLKQK